METTAGWTRGATIGRGSSATVSLAVASDRRVMAVKSAPLSHSLLLRREKSILAHLHSSPHIVRCLGEDFPSGAAGLYNLFLEYVPGGSLSDLLSRSGGRLHESAVRRYTRSLLHGLQFIHAHGYVHCDVKLQNVLVCDDRRVKIADFGLAKKAAERVDAGSGRCLQGTPLYMAPESVARDEYEAPADIWSLGCTVAEMISGRPAWNCPAAGDVWPLLMRIGFGDELPDIPAEFSEEGKDFLRKCLIRDPRERWTAEMLLSHPFIASLVEDDAEDFEQPLVDIKLKDCHPSPRSAFDFSESMLSMSVESVAPECSANDAVDRIWCLAAEQRPDWSFFSNDDGWTNVRDHQCTSCKSEEQMASRDEGRGGYRRECDSNLDIKACT